MIILTLSVGFPNSLNDATISGEVKNAYTLVKLLERKGHKKFVISAPTIWQSNKKPSSFANVVRSSAGIGRGVFRYISRALFMTPQVYKMLSSNKVDVIHCHSPIQLLPVWLTKAMLPRARGVSVFVTAHGTYLPESQADIEPGRKIINFLKKFNSWVQWKIDITAYRYFNGVIVTSDFQVKEMKEIYKLDAKVVHVIYNPAVPYFDRLYKNGKAHLSKIKKSKSCLVEILFVGRFVRKKGLINLVKACGILINDGVPINLTCVGGGMIDKNMMSEIQETIANDGLADSIKIRGSVSELELAKLYRDSDCLIVPSIGYESIPTVVIEALKSGTTVFATGKWGIPEVLVDKDNWLLENSVEDIVQKINSLGLKPISRNKYLEKLDGEYIVRQHENLFSSGS